MAGGWKKFHSKILEWRWYTDANTFRLFFHLIMTASYEDKPWKNIVIKRGQRVASRLSLSEELHLSQKQIRTALDHLKETGEITSTWAGDYSIITVLNYDKYQDLYCEGGSDADDERAKQGPTDSGQIQKKPRKRASERANEKANEKASINAENDNEGASGKANERAKQGPSKGQQEGHIYRDIDIVDDIDSTPPTSSPDPVPYQEIQEAFNATCTGLKNITAMTKTRRRAVRARWKEYPDIQTFRELFSLTARSDFLNGLNDRSWIANFDWLMNEQNMVKVLEGRYENRTEAKTNGGNDRAGTRQGARYVEQHREEDYEQFCVS